MTLPLLHTGEHYSLEPLPISALSTQSVNNGDVLQFNAGAWIAAPPPILTHSHPLTDISQSGALIGQTPVWNGAQWQALNPVSWFNAGILQGRISEIDLTGSGATANVVGNRVTLNVEGGGIQVSDEGVALGAATAMNFVGMGVLASLVGGVATVTVTNAGNTGINATNLGGGLKVLATEGVGLSALQFRTLIAGAGVTLTLGPNNITIASGLTIRDEGLLEGSNINTLNFVGAGVSVNNVGSEITVPAPTLSNIFGAGARILSNPGNSLTFDFRRIIGAGSAVVTENANDITITTPNLSITPTTIQVGGISQGQIPNGLTVLNFFGQNGINVAPSLIGNNLAIGIEMASRPPVLVSNGANPSTSADFWNNGRIRFYAGAGMSLGVVQNGPHSDVTFTNTQAGSSPSLGVGTTNPNGTGFATADLASGQLTISGGTNIGVNISQSGSSAVVELTNLMTLQNSPAVGNQVLHIVGSAYTAKRMVAGANMTITENTDQIIFNSSGGGGGGGTMNQWRSQRGDGFGGAASTTWIGENNIVRISPGSGITIQQTNLSGNDVEYTIVNDMVLGGSGHTMLNVGGQYALVANPGLQTSHNIKTLQPGTNITINDTGTALVLNAAAGSATIISNFPLGVPLINGSAPNYTAKTLIAGTNVTLNDNGNQITINAAGGGGGGGINGIDVQQNGVSLGSSFTALNFTGVVGVAAAGSTATINIPVQGGGGGGSFAFSIQSTNAGTIPINNNDVLSFQIINSNTLDPTYVNGGGGSKLFQWTVPLGGGGGGVNSVGGSAPIISSGGANPVISLGLSGVISGNYGSSTQTPVLTVDGHGLITAITTVPTAGGGFSGVATFNGQSGNINLVNGTNTTVVDLGSGNFRVDVPNFPAQTTLANGGIGAFLVTGSAPNYVIKSISAGTNVSIVQNANDITINAVGGGGGGATTTISNIGGGNQLVTGLAPTYNIKTIVAGTNMSINDDGNHLIFNAAGGGVSSVGGSSPIISSGGANPVISLANSGAIPGSYGSSTLIPVVTIDSHGLVTGVTTVAAAGGGSINIGNSENPNNAQKGLVLSGSTLTLARADESTVGAFGLPYVNSNASTTIVATGLLGGIASSFTIKNTSTAAVFTTNSLLLNQPALFSESTGSSPGIIGVSNTGPGLFGITTNGIGDSAAGVQGHATGTGCGVIGQSASGIGVLGFTFLPNGFGIIGRAHNPGGTGVHGSGSYRGMFAEGVTVGLHAQGDVALSIQNNLNMHPGNSVNINVTPPDGFFGILINGVLKKIPYWT